MLIDIVKQPNQKTTRCSNWREHHQIRRFIDSLDSLGYIDEEKQQAVLVVVDRQDPCKTRIITEDLRPRIVFPRHINCRSVIV